MHLHVSLILDYPRRMLSEEKPEVGMIHRPRVVSYWIILLEAAILRSLKQSLKEFEISEAQFIILDMCFRGEANTAGSIARLTHYDPSVISRQVENLFQKGLLNRHRSPTDRRVVHLSLTNEARTLREELLRAAIEADERITRHLDPKEHDILLDLVRKLVITLEKKSE